MTPERSGRKAGLQEQALVHLDALHGLALRPTGGDEAGSEDPVREAVVRALRSRDSCEVGTSGRAWRTTILRSTFVADVRRRTKRPTPVASDDAAETGCLS